MSTPAYTPGGLLFLIQRTFLPAMTVLVMLLSGTVGARAESDAGTDPATLYQAGRFEDALRALVHREGLVSLGPALETVRGRVRAGVFLDIARCHYAIGDTAKAHSALRYAYVLAGSAGEGSLGPPDEAHQSVHRFLAQLSLAQRRAVYGRTSPVKAAGRSLILPGWGQIYRGHRKRGFILMGVTTALGAYAALAVRDYNSARDAYRDTDREELSLPEGGDPAEFTNPFSARFERLDSRTRRANTAVAALAAVWGYAVLENLIIGPNRLTLRVPIR